MNNENETNLISGVVNADGDEYAVENPADSNNSAVEATANKSIPDTARPKDNADIAAAAIAETGQTVLDNDIVERIIDRVVERMATAPRTVAKNEAAAGEHKGQRRSTPNFLAAIRPDFWDRP